MTGKARRTPDYLAHRIEAIRRIEAYTAGMDREAFLADLRTQDAVIRNLEIIGEAARNVQRHDPAFVAAHPEAPWAIAYRMCNVLSHGYADVDLGIVWSTAETALPDLRDQVTKLLAALP